VYRRWLVGVTLLIAGVFALAFLRRVVLDRKALSPDYGTVATDSRLARPLHLVHFPLYRQAHPYSCGPATISMVFSYLDAPVTEEEYSARAGLSGRQEGMLPRVFLQHLQSALPTRTVKLVSDESPRTVLALLHSQLAAGTPVPIYFSTANTGPGPAYDTHYSAVTGMDLAHGVVHVANVYGFEEDVGLSDFFARLSFANYQDEPLSHRLSRLTGYIAKNNLYVISPPP
jgi:hypothetical protein